MAKTLIGVLILLLAIFLTMVLSLDSESAVPAVYLFGDSTFDVGTNNFLNDSSARADKKPYGIDFPNKNSTGRFSNGYNTADTIVKLFGLKESPLPYLYLVNNDMENFKCNILKGANFASGGAGIMRGTGTRPYTHVVSLEEQIQQFATARDNISQYLNDTAEATINKSLFLISVGSNDIFEFFIFNMSNNPNINNTNLIAKEVREFFNTLITNYKTHLENLLKLGARKFGILSVPPIGCVPIITGGSDPCVDQLNVFAVVFLDELGSMLNNLSSEFPHMKYSVGNSYKISRDMIDNHDLHGLSNVTSACCGNATLKKGENCGPDAKVCDDRYQFLFWDQYHPTEHASKIAATKVYSGSSEYVTPMNFSLLLQP